ncbi:MAG: putative quinol monooxygenase [Parvibaculales bacterium]
MIFVAGTMMMNPAIIDDFEKRVADMVEDVRAEDGCLHYSLLVEDKATGKVNVMEMWRDDDALAVHFTQPWIAAFLETFGGEMLDSTVQIYDISGSRPLPG